MKGQGKAEPLRSQLKLPPPTASSSERRQVCSSTFPVHLANFSPCRTDPQLRTDRIVKNPTQHAGRSSRTHSIEKTIQNHFFSFSRPEARCPPPPRWSPLNTQSPSVHLPSSCFSIKPRRSNQRQPLQHHTWINSSH